MTVYPSSRMQAERTIAAGRVALAASSLFAVWLDPAEPAHFAQTTYELLFVYLAYALLLAVGTWRWGGGTRLPIVTHVVDIVVFSIIQYFTGPVEPVLHVFHVLDVLRRDPLGPERHADDWRRRDRHLCGHDRDDEPDVWRRAERIEPDRHPHHVSRRHGRDARVSRPVRGATPVRHRAPGSMAGTGRQEHRAGIVGKPRACLRHPRRPSRARRLGSRRGTGRPDRVVVGERSDARAAITRRRAAAASPPTSRTRSFSAPVRSTRRRTSS